MAGPKKIDPKQLELMREVASRGGPPLEKLIADQQAPRTQKDATWDRNPDRLAPSEGGGVTSTFKRAEASVTPLQPPVGAMAPSANEGMTLGSALEKSGTDGSALNGLWKDREAKAGLTGP